VALDAGEPGSAAEHALSSADSAEGIGAVVEAALSRTLAGRALAQAGDADQAGAELSQAAAALDACGATRYRDAAEQELRKQGHRIHRQTRAVDPGGGGIGSLTERELEVARLVVDRKTNAEIAAELFLSVKTIESHMRNLFHKLGVPSRIEVARTIERADRTTDA
jgi:DNA-binding NarL/FixJ family response regulator